MVFLFLDNRGCEYAYGGFEGAAAGKPVLSSGNFLQVPKRFQ
jgi:hypothetical protein